MTFHWSSNTLFDRNLNKHNSDSLNIILCICKYTSYISALNNFCVTILIYKYHSIRGCGRHFAFHNTQYTFYAFVFLLNILIQRCTSVHFHASSYANRITTFSCVTRFHNTQCMFYAFILLLNFLFRYWLSSHFYVLSCTNKITIFSRVTRSPI